jgi:hypothetical protein
MAYVFMVKSGQTDIETMIKERPGMFMNGAHHARELTTISMNVYIMLKVLWSWEHRGFVDESIQLY